MGLGGKKKGKGKKKKKGKMYVSMEDMPYEMKNDVVECFREAASLYGDETDMAVHLKKELDKKYGRTWHCVVGREFGSNVTYQVNNFIHVFVDRYAVLAFKTQ